MTIAYENQLLGAFIYALGYESGSRGKSVPANLFQQTPLDGTFGDLVAGANWCVALEFKRQQSDISSERKKWSPGLLTQFQTNTKLINASHKGHLLCFGRHRQEGIDLACDSYPVALGLSGGIRDFSGSVLAKKLVEYADKQETPLFGLPPKHLQAYLEFLRKFRKETIGGRGKVEGTWLAVSAANSQYRILAASSLEQLLGLQHTLEREHLRGRDVERDMGGPSL